MWPIPPGSTHIHPCGFGSMCSLAIGCYGSVGTAATDVYGVAWLFRVTGKFCANRQVFNLQTWPILHRGWWCGMLYISDDMGVGGVGGFPGVWLGWCEISGWGGWSSVRAVGRGPWAHMGLGKISQARFPRQGVLDKVSQAYTN